MGNCLAFCKPSSGSPITNAMAKQGKVVMVAKPDGKILEFSSPIHVKDILINFPALSIGVSKEAAESLSPDFELKAGSLYYLLPPLCCPLNTTSIETRDRGSGIKRIKIVITKHQLQQLVTKQISVEDLLAEVQEGSVHLPLSNRKPKLDSIPEENE